MTPLLTYRGQQLQPAKGFGCHQTATDSHCPKMDENRNTENESNNGVLEIDSEEKYEEENVEEEENSNTNDDDYKSRLFEIKGSKKLEWKFARLVAKKGTNMLKVTSKDAANAYCLLCKSNITYSMENGNSVYRHMSNNHKHKMDELSNEEV